jgi:hypothetical protein
MITSDYSDTQGGLGPLKGRKISLPDEVHDRLWLLARQRRTTVSAVATEILDKNLPRYLSRARGLTPIGPNRP